MCLKWTNRLAAVLLFLLFSLPPSAYSQDLYSGTLDQMLASIEELERLEQEKQNELNSLRNTNKERATEIEEKEKELSELRLQLSLLKASARERERNSRNLEKSITFWRTSTIILGTTTCIGIITIAIMANK